MAESKRKRTFICISSSSEEEVEDSDNEDEEEEDDDDDEDDADDDDEVDADEDDDEDDKEEEDDDDCAGGDDESLCNKVVRLLKDGSDLESLTLKDCKSYLRKHGLRLAGTKAVCIQRIKEHWRMKDGSSEAFYPRSTFVINCTGDVCKGDVVLFTQKVYERFNKVTRHGRPQGKRTVAGRVVKESYGAAKQQHTFTVEVLWSKGSNRLPPLFPLLVKGRNLYKLRTFRQRWSNESERMKVLAEKHKRGTAARLVRAMKNTKKTRSTNGGVKHQKQFHHTRPSQSRKTFSPEKGKHFDRHGKATFQGHAKSRNHNQRQEAPPLRQVNIRGNAILGASKPTRRHQKFAHHNDDRVPTFQSYVVDPSQIHQSQIKYQNGSLPHHLSRYDTGFS
ncbi:zinc finger CCCH domain-containing protein 62 isoform X2 [Alnus glutinosa]|uniref:zinc finger CCCH domain-containing protein 62 isoform X2 n=1 Tax=Alnus glutinosa TaxID=3517 RepID=UPI002D79E14E|nr:zinc finger CCCH domain-containing protein 62 isoform X2 [Alnus glutinosa]